MDRPARSAAPDPGAGQDDAARLDRRNEDVFAEAERQGLMLAAKVRTYALSAVLLWAAIDNPATGMSYLYDLSEVGSFAVLGVVQYLFAKKNLGMRVLKYVFVAVDCALLAVILSAQNPFDDYTIPPAVAMNGSMFTYFFLFLMQASFSFRPSLVLWCGACIATARTGMLVWLVGRPGAFTNLDLTERSVDTVLAARADPNFVFLGFWAQEVLVSTLVAVGLAALVRRSRRLVMSRVVAERSRANLARYFSPNVVDRLAGSGGILEVAREQDVAVLFADIVGFTTMCEREAPGTVVAFLRSYHDRLGKAVFDNHGTLDKYLGDGLMATFGTPEPGPADAANALGCALDMIGALEAWNRERAQEGDLPVRIGIGIHYGPVIAGDLGNRRRLEYSVIGDTVNVASRLEHLTRSLDAALVVSGDLVAAVGRDDARGQGLVARLERAGLQSVRGRRGGIEVWVYRPSDAGVQRSPRGGPRA